jgi:hypothetical protein
VNRGARRAALATAAVAGMAAGVAVTLSFADADDAARATSTSVTTTTTSAPPSTTTSTVPVDAPEVLLVWTSGGLPAGLADQVRSLDGVDEVALVHGDETAMSASFDDAGDPVDVLADGWRIPLDTIAVEPASFSSFLDGPAAAAVESLQPGDALLTETSAKMRHDLGPGATIRLEGGTVRIAGIIDDESGASAELIVSAADAPKLGVVTERYLLVHHTAERDVLERTIAERFLDGRAVRFRSPGETTWLRHGDAVQPNLVMKTAFGEFSYRAGDGRQVVIDPAWVDEWIVTESVPILGPVTCHRKVMEPLRAALQELTDSGLGHLVDAADFAGCYSARRIEAGQPMSHHAWGAALDLNVDGNPRGSFSTQDERLVEVMAHHGFGWGGAWLVPDPAHYEAPTG